MNTTIILSILINIISLQPVNDNDNIVYHPIGYFDTEYTTKTGAPRQGTLVPEGKGRIILKPEYRDALDFVNWFEYIIVLFHFHLVQGWESHVEPPASNHEHDFGLFSTRSPKRPNPIGFSIIKLEKISGDTLFVSGIDAFDGTPVLDIKPYLPSVDMIKSVQNELIEKELGHHDDIYIKDSIFYR